MGGEDAVTVKRSVIVLMGKMMDATEKRKLLLSAATQRFEIIPDTFQHLIGARYPHHTSRSISRETLDTKERHGGRFQLFSAGLA